MKMERGMRRSGFWCLAGGSGEFFYMLVGRARAGCKAEGCA